MKTNLGAMLSILASKALSRKVDPYSQRVALRATAGEIPVQPTPSKGVRSRRRRAARMRARGFVHIDGTGWVDGNRGG